MVNEGWGKRKGRGVGDEMRRKERKNEEKAKGKRERNTEYKVKETTEAGVARES